MRFALVYILLVALSIPSIAQDIHFSQFNSSYLNLNPALTGNFDGTYRFNANFRNQWSSVSEPFRTFSFSVEKRSPIEQVPNLHLGLSFFNDEAGVGGLRQTQVNINLGYDYALNQDSTWVVLGGLQSGYSARAINFNAFSFDEQYDGVRFNENLDNGESFDRNTSSSFNLAFGFGLVHLIDHRKKVFLNSSFFNLTRPDQNFQEISVPLEIRNNFSIGAEYIIAEDLDLLPGILYARQGDFSELIVGSNVRYYFEKDKSFGTNLYGGLWYRNQDAIIVKLGLDYLQWNFGMSYDLNVSDLRTATNNRGGLELALTYIFKEFKPSIRRYKVCPRFM